MIRDDFIQPGEIRIRPGDALVVVDMQNDFMPGGALPVQEGDAFVSDVNEMMRKFYDSSLPVVLTQDWHPRGHRSFASAHAGRTPFDLHEERGIGPVLWPDHCVQGSRGAGFHQDLMTHFAQATIRKGFRVYVDSYSAFIENDRTTTTGLDGYLRDRGVRRTFVCGLALDYCVLFSTCDGVDLGYEVVTLLDLTRPVGSPPGSAERALRTMKTKGVLITRSTAIVD